MGGEKAVLILLSAIAYSKNMIRNRTINEAPYKLFRIGY